MTIVWPILSRWGSSTSLASINASRLTSHRLEMADKVSPPATVTAPEQAPSAWTTVEAAGKDSAKAVTAEMVQIRSMCRVQSLIRFHLVKPEAVRKFRQES
jgi:hypothetical protein